MGKVSLILRVVLVTLVALLLLCQNVFAFSRGMMRMAVASPSPLLDAVNAIKNKQMTATELMRSTLEKIEETDGHVGAFLSVFGEDALRKAEEVDSKLAAGDPEWAAKPLLGLPVAVKDNLCVAGKPTTAASKVLEGYLPTYTAEAVARLEAAGAIVVGKVNLDEFAMGASTETSAYRLTRNPRALGHVPGGSSGGSAAAVAAGAVLAALGSDTGGSIRQPAAFCGAVGLKPSYGRVPRHGLLAYTSSTDVVGPLTATVKDAAALLQVLAGPAPDKDATSAAAPVPDYLAGLGEAGPRPLEGTRVGVIQEAENCAPEVAAAFKEAVATLEGLGAAVAPVSFPRLSEQCTAYYVNAFSEASANLARFDGIRYGLASKRTDTARGSMLNTRAGFGDEVKQRIILGTFALSAGYSDAFYKKAMDIRTLLAEEVKEAFKKVDILLCPTSPTLAYEVGAYAAKGASGYQDDVFTVPANLAGLPALSVPCAVAPGGLPIGLQFIGDVLREDLVLKTGYHFEQATKIYEKLQLDPALSGNTAVPENAVIGVPEKPVFTYEWGVEIPEEKKAAASAAKETLKSALPAERVQIGYIDVAEIGRAHV